MIYRAAVLTISDKGARGERVDTSGPAICEMLKEAGFATDYAGIVPDEMDVIKSELIKLSDEKGYGLVVTTGGTGFSPRDITPEATLAVIDRETRGIPEAMRAESMRITPRGCLSRGVAGIRGRTLIINLPGSKKAATENLAAVLDAVKHGMEMLYSAGSADCAAPEKPVKEPSPSMDEWIKEAKKAPNAEMCGMFLFHNGVVRETPKALVREGDNSRPPVKGMLFDYDTEKFEECVIATHEMPGIHYVKAWLNRGRLEVGDDIMYVLIGGDIRPHVVDALQYLVGRLKNECVSETELYG